MKYLKLDLSFGDKLRLLFFGLVAEDKLPIQESTKEVEKCQVVTENPTTAPNGNQNTINNDEEKLELHIPFFDTNDKDVESNF